MAFRPGRFRRFWPERASLTSTLNPGGTMRIVSADGAANVGVEGVEYQAVDGVFTVPHDVGVALLRFPGFITEQDSVVKAEAEHVRRRQDPATFAERLASVEARLAALESGIDAGRHSAQ